MMPYMMSETQLKEAVIKINNEDFDGKAEISLYPEDGVYGDIFYDDGYQCVYLQVKPDGLYSDGKLIQREL